MLLVEYMEAFVRVRKQGNSLVVAIPPQMRHELGLVQGDHLLISLRGDGLLLRKVEPQNLVRELGKKDGSDSAG